MLLEICASNIQSAINAQEAGAHRIELCQELAIGGITPSYGLLKNVLDSISILIFILIRPRSGDFTYSESEFEIMKHNIKLCKDLGASGIVSGILKKDNTIDVERTKELIQLASPLPFTFHRAFDWTPNPFQALEELIDIGASRVLTSGQETSALKGLNTLIQLQKQAKGRITILPGSSINSKNTHEFKASGFNEIHASASKIIQPKNSVKLSMNSSQLLSDVNVYSDSKKIKSILKTISNED